MCPGVLARIAAVAAALALTGCAGAGNPTPQEAAVPGVPSVPLTSPWKELNLPIDGGVVDASTPNMLSVRFPATPPEALSGLGAAIQDALVGRGWTALSSDSSERDAYYAEFTSVDGKAVSLHVSLDRWDGMTAPGRRPVLLISIH